MLNEISSPPMATEGGSKSNTGLIVLGVLATLGIGYYFFVYKPAQEAKKQQQGV